MKKKILALALGIAMVFSSCFNVTAILAIDEEVASDVTVNETDKILVDSDGNPVTDFDYISFYDENDLATISKTDELGTTLFGLVNLDGLVVVDMKYNHIDLQKINGLSGVYKLTEWYSSEEGYQRTREGLVYYDKVTKEIKTLLETKFYDLSYVAYDGTAFILPMEDNEFKSEMYYFDSNNFEFMKVESYALSNQQIRLANIEREAGRTTKVSYYGEVMDTITGEMRGTNLYTYIDNMTGELKSDIINEFEYLRYLDIPNVSNEYAIIGDNVYKLEKNEQNDILKQELIISGNEVPANWIAKGFVTANNKTYFIDDNGVHEILEEYVVRSNGNYVFKEDEYGSIMIPADYDKQNYKLNFLFGENAGNLFDYGEISFFTDSVTETIGVGIYENQSWIDITGTKVKAEIHRYYKNIGKLNFNGQEILLDLNKINKNTEVFINGEVNPIILLDENNDLIKEAEAFYALDDANYEKRPCGIYYKKNDLLIEGVYDNKGNELLIFDKDVSQADYYVHNGKNYVNFRYDDGSGNVYATEDCKYSMKYDVNTTLNFIESLNVFYFTEHSNGDVVKTAYLNDKFEELFISNINLSYYDDLNCVFVSNSVDGIRYEDIYKFNPDNNEFDLIISNIRHPYTDFAYEGIWEKNKGRFVNIHQYRDNESVPAVFDKEKKQIVKGFDSFVYDEEGNMIVYKNNTFNIYNKEDGTFRFSEFVEGKLAINPINQLVKTVKINGVNYYEIEEIVDENDYSKTNYRYIDKDGNLLFGDMKYVLKGMGLTNQDADIFNVIDVNKNDLDSYDLIYDVIDKNGNMLIEGTEVNRGGVKYFELNDKKYVMLGTNRYSVYEWDENNGVILCDVTGSTPIELTEPILSSRYLIDNGEITVFKLNNEWTDVISAVMDAEGNYRIPFPDDSVLARSAFSDGIAIEKTVESMPMSMKSRRKARNAESIGIYDEYNNLLIDLTSEYEEVKLLGNNTALGLKDGQYILLNLDVEKQPFVEIENIKISTMIDEIEQYQSIPLTVEVTPNNATIKNVTWSSSDESIAYVYDGMLYAQNPGTCTITASSSNGKTDQIAITVNEYKNPVQLDRNIMILEVGDTVKLNVDTDITDSTIFWGVSDESLGIVSIDQNGVVTALKEGDMNVYAPIGMMGDGCFVRVVNELDINVEIPNSITDINAISLKETLANILKGDVVEGLTKENVLDIQNAYLYDEELTIKMSLSENADKDIDKLVNDYLSKLDGVNDCGIISKEDVIYEILVNGEVIGNVTSIESDVEINKEISTTDLDENRKYYALLIQDGKVIELDSKLIENELNYALSKDGVMVIAFSEYADEPEITDPDEGEEWTELEPSKPIEGGKDDKPTTPPTTEEKPNKPGETGPETGDTSSFMFYLGLLLISGSVISLRKRRV